MTFSERIRSKHTTLTVKYRMNTDFYSKIFYGYSELEKDFLKDCLRY